MTIIKPISVTAAPSELKSAMFSTPHPDLPHPPPLNPHPVDGMRDTVGALLGKDS